MVDKKISKKTEFILRFILLSFLIILFKIWHLSVIQREKRLEDAINPQRKVIIQHANRGAIYDRYHLPLAINRIRYNAAVYYSQLKQIPTIAWKKDIKGKRIKYFPRREYISQLSHMLAKELNSDPLYIEDLIHAKASLFPHIPYVIKENISENQYFKIRMKERNWIGLHGEIDTERFYPHKKCGANIIGYLGAINQNEYISIAKEIKALQEYLDLEKEENLPLLFASKEEVIQRLGDLKKRAYTINDLIGKTGIEKQFDEKLRGFHGKKSFAVDIKGNFLKELPEGENPIAGNPIFSTISVKLQNYAEKLLAQDEKIRTGKSRIFDFQKKESVEQKQPWIKGGAIVALDPNSGEVLALASYPRFNPNDFITSKNSKIQTKKGKRLLRWLELDRYIANIWDGQELLSREFYSPQKKRFYNESQQLTLEFFLDLILSPQSMLKDIFKNICNIKNAISLQEDVDTLLYYSNQNVTDALFDILFPQSTSIAKISPLKRREMKSILQKKSADILPLKHRISSFLSPIDHNGDKLLVIDICRCLINSPAFSDELIEKVGKRSLTSYWNFSKATLKMEKVIKNMVYPLFHEIFFKNWREKKQTEYLKKIRNKENLQNTFHKPYIDHLNRKQRQLFSQFWQKNRLNFLVTLIKGQPLASENISEIAPYLTHLLNVHDKIAHGSYNEASWISSVFILKKELSELDAALASNFLKTVRSFNELDRPLLYNYPRLKKRGNIAAEKDLAASFYPRYGFGYVKSHTHNTSAPLGSIFKIVTAYSALKQRYNFLTNNHLPLDNLNPLTMIDNVKWDPQASKGGSLVVGYTLNNKPYTRFYKGGRLPKSPYPNLGKVDLLQAIERSSNPYFSILASDFLNDPSDLLEEAKNCGFGKKTGLDLMGEIPGFLPKDIKTNRTGLYSLAIGQHSLVVTPLQTAVMLAAIANKGLILKPKIQKNSDIELKNKIFLPDSIRNILLEGLHLVVAGKKGSARPSKIKKFYGKPHLVEEYKNLTHQIIGKTSTAEIMYNPNVSPSSKAQKYKHTWFGAISFKDNVREKPELVVVVYLRYGDGGKEAAPLAFQMVKKYRKIKNRHKSL